MTNLADKIGGALFGVAVGDALGAPLEFMNAKEIQHKHERRMVERKAWRSYRRHANDNHSSHWRSNAPGESGTVGGQAFFLPIEL